MKRRLVEALGAFPGVSEYPSQFAPRPAWWIDGREFAHFEEGCLELRLTRSAISSRRTMLKSDPRVELRGGDWIRVRTTGDPETIIELARLAAGANRRGPGDPPRPTPDERSLARRRRLHGAADADLG